MSSPVMVSRSARKERSSAISSRSRSRAHVERLGVEERVLDVEVVVVGEQLAQAPALLQHVEAALEGPLDGLERRRESTAVDRHDEAERLVALVVLVGVVVAADVLLDAFVQAPLVRCSGDELVVDMPVRDDHGLGDDPCGLVLRAWSCGCCGTPGPAWACGGAATCPSTRTSRSGTVARMSALGSLSARPSDGVRPGPAECVLDVAFEVARRGRPAGPRSSPASISQSSFQPRFLGGSPR